jgi:hypothetical protein
MPQHEDFSDITSDDARWVIITSYWWHSTWILFLSLWFILTPPDRFGGAPWQYLMIVPHGDNLFGVFFLGLFFYLAYTLVTKRTRMFGRAVFLSGFICGLLAGLLLVGGIYGNRSGLGAPCLIYIFAQSLILSVPLTKQQNGQSGGS